MGYDAGAITAIGLKVPAGDLMVEKTVRIKKGPKGAKFDPETGAALFDVRNDPIEGYEPWDHLTVGKRKFEVKYANGEDDKVVISVWSQSAGGYGDQFQFVSLNEIPTEEELEADKAILREALGELWNEDNFGLFTLLYESY
jgi:hypothetical protein